MNGAGVGGSPPGSGESKACVSKCSLAATCRMEPALASETEPPVFGIASVGRSSRSKSFTQNGVGGVCEKPKKETPFERHSRSDRKTVRTFFVARLSSAAQVYRSEEHTSELQSHS